MFIDCTFSPFPCAVPRPCPPAPPLTPPFLRSPRGLASESFGTSTTSLVAAFRDINKTGKPRQPVFQRDWYDVHT